jgi:hypothetical protein
VSEPYAPLVPVGKPHLDGRYVMFSARHGRLHPSPPDEAWAARHAAPSPPTQRTCLCPGCQPNMIHSDEHGPWSCAQDMTQEDGLCDECRAWCVAVDHAGRYHCLVDLWNPNYRLA